MQLFDNLYSRTRLQCCAIDMTLALGAASHVDARRRNNIADPDARELLCDLLDLVLNCRSLQLIIPSKTASPPRVLKGLLECFQTLPKGTVSLPESVEKAVRRRFLRLALSQNLRLKQWVAFQTTHPLVTESHWKRMQDVSSRAGPAERRLVSDEGFEYWNRSTRYRKRLLERLPGEWDDLSLPRNYAEDARRFRSPTDFLLCYTFDVFRRGWQYQQRSSVAGAVYVPHYLRNEALEAEASAWSVLASESRRYWSWGNYLVEVLDEEGYRHWRTPEGLVDVIKRLQTAMKSTGCPTWFQMPDFDRLSVTSRKNLVDLIETTAEGAKLPLLWRKKQRSSRQSMHAAWGAAEGGVGLLSHLAGGAIHAVHLIYGSVHLLMLKLSPFTAAPETGLRKLVRPALRGRLERRGLYGSKLAKKQSAA